MTEAEMMSKLQQFGLSKFGAAEVIESLTTGEELVCECYDVLFEHFSKMNKIPYGTASGKDGDPFEWITQTVRKELGIE